MKTAKGRDRLAVGAFFWLSVMLVALVALPAPRAAAHELCTSDDESPWDRFVPPPDEYDWIQLTSGEWLKGELKVLYDLSLEFDSSAKSSGHNC